jgi:outer membrane protein assembly factor BamB
MTLATIDHSLHSSMTTMRHLLAAAALTCAPTLASADDWPQYLGPNHDNVWRETGVVEQFPAGGPKILWRQKVAGGYAGVAVADGRVYVADFVSPADPKAEVYDRTDNEGSERLLCFDAATGKSLWSFEYPMKYKISFPNGPRATPTVNDGRVYMLGAEGRLSCLDARTGRVAWQKDFKADYHAKTPHWGFAGHPFIDGDKLICIVGGADACVVAFDRKTGKELWKNLNAAEPGYGSPAIVEVGKQRQLLIWHAESVNALEPETGKKLWSVPLKASNGSAIMAPIKHGDHLFVGGFSHQCKGMKLTSDMGKPEVLWEGTTKTGLYPVNCQPFAEGGLMYGVCQNGELRCVEIATGKRLWEELDPVAGKRGECGTAFLVKNGDRFFILNERGELLIAKLSRGGYTELGRAKVIDPTGTCSGRDVVFCPPAFAGKRMYVRNDKEVVCVSLEK